LIDVSDGVASDLGHICRESQLGAIIDEEKIPVTDLFKIYCENFKLDFEYLTLHVGQDYVLLGTVTEDSAQSLKEALNSSGCEFYPIGQMVKGKGVKIRNRDGSLREIQAKGYDHFKKNT
jgi:thiamine-monophosphate kinase